MGSPGISRVWDPSNHLRAEFSLNLPYESLKIIEYKTHFCDLSDCARPLRLIDVPLILVSSAEITLLEILDMYFFNMMSKCCRNRYGRHARDLGNMGDLSSAKTL
jgi:hypothetical protein